MAVGASALDRTGPSTAGWLRSPAWDLTFVSLSAGLVVIPYFLYRAFLGAGLDERGSAAGVDVVVTLLVGGPHMYATFTRTVADPVFRAHHQRIIATSALIPIGVVVMGLWAFPILLSLFFFWASVHVLHQIAFLIECYNRRAPRPPTWFERATDYAVVMTSLYPLAVWRLVNGTFEISGQRIVLPELLRTELLVWAALGAFGVSLVLWLGKTARELARGSVHWPKLLLIGLTVVVSFLLPGVDRLDAAFQGFNAWHSFQYLGLTWYANKLAAERGQGAAVFATGPRFYGAMVACTLGAGVILGVLMLLRGPLGLTPEQPYYITILSFLLVHYYHDHVLFQKPEDLVATA